MAMVELVCPASKIKLKINLLPSSGPSELSRNVFKMLCIDRTLYGMLGQYHSSYASMRPLPMTPACPSSVLQPAAAMPAASAPGFS